MIMTYPNEAYAVSDDQLDSFLATAQVTTEEAAEETEEESTQEAEETLNESDSDESVDEDSLDTEEESESENDTSEDSDTSEEDTDTEEDNKDKKPSEAELLASLFEPFKAGGEMVTVKDLDEVKRLMKMGVGFYKKSEALKPYSKLIHSLEKNGLTDPSKLGHLIDVVNKKPGAVKKLLNDLGVDAYAIESDESEYVPDDHNVSDNELALNDIIKSNQDNNEFNEMLVSVGKWDKSSKDTISQHPKILELLTEDLNSGVYKTVTAEVARQRMLGSLSGMTDIQAYRQVALNMAAQVPPDNQKPTKEPVQSDGLDRENRRKRASPSVSTAAQASTKNSDINLYDLSDEELAKL